MWTKSQGTAAVIFTFLVVFLSTSHVASQNVTSDIFLLDPTNSTGNVTQSGQCANRPDNIKCPDPAIIFYLYSGNDGEAQIINVADPDWFKTSKYDPTKPTVMLIHGYRGGDSLAPLVVLKNAYIKQGDHNLIMVDWGALAKVPCFVQTVSNMKPVAKCIANTLAYFRKNGVVTEKITCIGHSLGAHVCGILANFIPKKMEKIIALDPSRPLMNSKFANGKLNSKDAEIVQVIHSNAGFYGQTDVIGTVDFCINNGIQPYCKNTRNEQLCSHLHAVCYMAESLDIKRAQTGTPCNNKCPFGKAAPSLPPFPTKYPRDGEPIYMGVHLKTGVTGMHCVTNEKPPYCLNPEEDPNYGDKRCCPVYPDNPRGPKTEEEIKNALYVK